ncbi:MAG TPA: energy transducer TonB [Longimicrobium sp.]|nr:energy transducer TonB [Longimicrobium sp.]
MPVLLLLLAFFLVGCGGTPPPAAAPEALAADTASAEIPRITPASRRNIPFVLRRVYPVLLRDAGVGASVHARFVVLADGTVARRSIVIIDADNDLFADAAVMALPQLHFTPARENGAPTFSGLRATLTFSPDYPPSTIEFDRPTAPAAGRRPR